MTRQFGRLAQRLFNVPLAITPAKAEMVAAAIADRLGIATIGGLAPRPMAWFDDDDDRPTVSDPYADKGYDLVDGAAIILIEGTLVKKTSTLRPYSGMTGYDGIRQNLLTAIADPAVKGIVLDIDSPGGEVAGCFDLVDAIYAQRGEKPIMALVDELAASAAYAIASAADAIAIPRTGLAGSIGAVMMHVDWSQAIGKAGLDVTFIQRGARKTDGAPEKPLDPEALRRFQADIDRIGDIFDATVARNRRLDVEKIRAQEAAVFMGDEAVDAGLADAVMPAAEAFAGFLESL